MYPQEIFKSNKHVANALIRSFEPSYNGATSCTVEDDRNAEQQITHYMAVVALDKGMSGWGSARGGTSRCAWAFDHNQVNSDRVFNWVKKRSDMRHVYFVDLRTYRPRKGTAHFHIYVCNPDHVAAKG
jgi:hypothetical protein